MTASVVTGSYVDPKAGKETVRAYAERWREMQVHRPSTAELVEIVLRRHVYPRLGERPLTSHIRAYPPGPDGLVFTGAGGQPIRRNAFSMMCGARRPRWPARRPPSTG